MDHSCVLLLCEVAHNNHLAGPYIQSWKRKPGIVFCTLLSLLRLVYSWPVDSDLYLGGTVPLNSGIITKLLNHLHLEILEPWGNGDSA